MSTKKKTKQEIMDRFFNSHGDRYIYPEFTYENQGQYIKIICKEHGEFTQRIDIHSEGHGCKLCYFDDKKTDSKVFFDKCNEVHNSKYKYFDDYTLTQNKIKIECSKHGVFYKRGHHHLQGDGCSKCKIDEFNKERLKEFISNSNVIHNNKFNYDKSIYIGYRTELIITCPVHGDFKIKPINHINGNDCKKCTTDIQKKTHGQFIIDANKTHNNFYTYNHEYTTSKNNIIITCPVHGDFSQSPNNHIKGAGCKKCKNSRGETKVMNVLISFGVGFIQEYKFDGCKLKMKLPFDFYLPDYNTCVEFDGDQHYRPYERFGGEAAFEKQKIRDNIKNEYCKNNNIRLIRIRRGDNIEEIIKELLSHDEETA